MKGNIVKYFSRRGFGFIAPQGSEDEIFFHVSNFPEGVEPQIGNDVEFDLVEVPKGREAKNIKVQAAAEEEPFEEEGPEEEPPVEEAPEAEAPEASGLAVGDIKGVGKATEEKLRGAGFETVDSIAAVDGDAVAEKAGISTKVAVKIVASAKELLK
jgi:cold shock CspA family protein